MDLKDNSASDANHFLNGASYAWKSLYRNETPQPLSRAEETGITQEKVFRRLSKCLSFLSAASH